MTIRFTKTDTDADGIGVYTSDEINTQGLRLQVWRAAGGGWRWGILWPSSYELPADSGAPSLKAAKQEAAAWWALHGTDGIDSVRCLFLGSWTRFLANTSERTAKSTQATRRHAALRAQVVAILGGEA